MGVEILPFDPSKRRPRKGRPPTEIPAGQVLRLDSLSDGVIKRVMLRQAQRELEQLNLMVKVTGGYLELYPTPDQIRAFYEDDLEY